eukprot:906517-Prymnesium_polylepis.1
MCGLASSPADFVLRTLRPAVWNSLTQIMWWKHTGASCGSTRLASYGRPVGLRGTDLMVTEVGCTSHAADAAMRMPRLGDSIRARPRSTA